MHTYVLVTTTHLGLPLPPTIDWLPKFHPPAGPVPLSTHPSSNFHQFSICLSIYLPTHLLFHSSRHGIEGGWAHKLTDQWKTRGNSISHGWTVALVFRLPFHFSAPPPTIPFFQAWHSPHPLPGLVPSPAHSTRRLG